jgi:DNA-directed RNA polymerase alpha subunit
VPSARPDTSENDFPKLSKPAQRALAGAGIHNLKELSRFSEAEIAKLHGTGPKSLVELRAALKSKGLSFAGPAER